MTYFSYRVIRTIYEVNGEQEVTYQIHQVWSKSVRGKIVGVSEHGSAPIGKTSKELQQDLSLMSQALLKPALDRQTLEEIVDALYPITVQ